MKIVRMPNHDAAKTGTTPATSKGMSRLSDESKRAEALRANLKKRKSQASAREEKKTDEVLENSQ